jgi:hypothetical protein
MHRFMGVLIIDLYLTCCVEQLRSAEFRQRSETISILLPVAGCHSLARAMDGVDRSIKLSDGDGRVRAFQ